MTTVQQAGTAKSAVNTNRKHSPLLPYVGVTVSGALLMFGSIFWTVDQTHMAGHALIIASAAIVSFSGLGLVRNSRHR